MLRFCTLIVLVFSCAVIAHGYEDGITGRAKTGCGGFGCHGAQSTNVSVSHSGATAVDAGGTLNMSVLVGHNALNTAGFNATIQNAQGGAAGQITAVTSCRVEGNDVTHIAPTAMTNNTATFSFDWVAPAQHGTYTLYAAGQAVNNNGNNDANDIWNLMSQTITVRGATINAPAAGAIWCRSSTKTISWTQTGYTTFRIEVSIDNGQNWTQIANNVNAASGSYDWVIPANQQTSSNAMIRLVNTANSQEVKRSATFNLSAPPSIIQQPIAQTVCEGQQVQLIIGVDVAGASIQWRKDAVDIVGATSATYTISNANITHDGNYDCVVSGCTTAVSSTVKVTINRKPTITQQPTSKTVCEGQNVDLKVSAVGTGLTYQWFKAGLQIGGATNDTYTITGADLQDDAEYYCEVSGTCLPKVTSNTVTITVNNIPAVTQQPQNVTVNVGQAISLDFTSTGKQLSYQWSKNGTPITGATNKVYSVAAATTADAGKYRCRITNTCGNVQTNEVTVTVNQPGQGQLSVAAGLIALSTQKCVNKDTTLTQFITNTGSAAVNITSITVDAKDNAVTVSGLTLPFSLAAGAKATITVTLSTPYYGLDTATVTLTGSQGAPATFDVLVSIGQSMAASEDSLSFTMPEGGTDTSCVTVAGTACSTIVVTALEIQGAAAAAYRIIDAPALPVVVSSSSPLQVCIEANDKLGAASLVITSDAGVDEVRLNGVATTSVDEEVVAGVRVSPIPARDGVTFAAATGEPFTVRVLSMDGRELWSSSGEGSMHWAGDVAAGVYVALIQRGGAVQTRMIIIN